MPLHLGGYTCDKCDTIVIPSPLLANEIRHILGQLPEKSLLRIYCPVCGTIKRQVEQTMLLKDVGDVKDIKNKN